MANFIFGFISQLAVFSFFDHRSDAIFFGLLMLLFIVFHKSLASKENTTLNNKTVVKKPLKQSQNMMVLPIDRLFPVVHSVSKKLSELSEKKVTQMVLPLEDAIKFKVGKTTIQFHRSS